MHTKLNILSIAGVKGDIHEFFSLIDQNLDAYSKNFEDREPINACRIYIHQLNGLFEMLELKDISIVNGKIEQLIIVLIGQQINPDETVITTIKQAAKTTLDYLDDLIEGAEENLQRLFPTYRNLMQLLGHDQVSAYDLFHPALTATPSFKTKQVHIAAEQSHALIKQARIEYQFGLAQWLKNTAGKDTLSKMRHAIDQLEQLSAGPTGQRTFWWVVGGFLECLLEQTTEIDMSSRKLCGKIEKTLRHFAQETSQETAQLTRELLYQIARHPRTDEENQQITDIRKAYALPSLSAPDDMTDLVVSGSSRDYLQEIQKTLIKINESWQAFCSGEQTELNSFIHQMAQIAEPALQTQSRPMQKLIAAISNAAETLHTWQITHSSSDMLDDVIMEIATALLHLESIVVNFNKRQDNLTELVDTICKRLNALTVPDETTAKAGEMAKTPGMPSFSDIENTAKNKEIQKQAATEMLVDLQQIEKTLEHFFRNPDDQDSVSALSALSPVFNQISGVLTMLGLGRVDHLLGLCHNLIQKFADPENLFNETEQNLLVDGISSLNFFLEAYKNDTADSQRIIEQAIAVFDSAAKQKDKLQDSTIQSLIENLDMSDVGFELESKASAETEPGAVENTEPMIKIDQGFDAELLGIFLEEADEVLAEIAQGIQRCQADNTDIKSLTAIRRGFHTLKGSSRMVSLEFFSDAAWLMEQTLNQWLNEKKQITRDLIHALDDAQQAFGQWCINLRNNGESEIDIPAIQKCIDDLNAANMQHALLTGHDEHAFDSAITEITIGDISIEPDLFDIFVKESKQHLETLEHELDGLLATHSAKISKPFTLAAHTLASTSRALGLTFIAKLSGALEEWLSRLMENQGQLKEIDTQLIQNGVQQLRDLLKKVYVLQFPDEIDLQLAQFLTQEINKRLSEKQVPEKTARSQEPINLSEYRLKKIPAYIQSAQPETPQQKPEESTDAELENISEELLHVFLEEAKDSMPRISEKIRAWRILPQNDEIRISLLRMLHTLKGSANMIGTGQLGEMIHTMESEVEEAFDQSVVPSYAIDKIEYEYDQLCEKIEWLQHKVLKPERVETGSEVLEEPSDTSRLETSDEAKRLDITETMAPPAVPVVIGAVAQESSVQPGGTLRVNAELIDRLVNDSGEISIIRTKIETQLNHFKQSLQDLTESIDRLHGQLREIEIQAETQMQSHIALQQNNDQSFDPLEFDRFTRFQELTRLMAESVDDVMTVQKNLSSAQSAAIEAVSQQALISKELQQELVRIRTIPFGTISERYYRIARKTAAEVDKKVSLSIKGEDVEIDRSVLEKISTSLEHILRNAIVHGIEKPSRRVKSRKPETGNITINLHREGNEVVIAVSDDGLGLDLKRIHKKAIRLGLIQKHESLDDDQIAALIFLPGLTTHTQVTGTAGRGMGMDIVQNDISGLGGQITIDTQKNKGTTFNIRLPLTLAVAQTLMISAGNQIFAIPSPIIAHIHELESEALQSAYQDHQIIFAGQSYPFTHLSLLLNQFHAWRNPLNETKAHNHVLILQNNASHLAIHVDELIGNQEVVVKNTGPQIMHAPGVEGATLTGEGLPVLILNPLKLLPREDVQHVLTTPLAELIDLSSAQEDTSAVVLVVDDSLTVRKVTGRLLEREGYRVLVAKNGLEAIETTMQTRPDIILADLEMPKMNGFELIENIRKNPDTAPIPIIVISSRTADKHRKMAEQLGANAFIGKPYKEEELLNRIRQYLDASNDLAPPDNA